MKRLATDQLSLAQIERNERQRPDELCNLDAICERVIDLLKEMASKADITIEFKPDKQPLFILGHHDELGQMVQNIVENAIRYGRAGGHVLISLHHRAVPPEHEDDHYCSIAISDDGEGIDKEHIPRLTERFYRVDKDRSRAKGGTGLGLAIVKHIVHHHRGILDIQSQPKKGSVFTIYFPLPDQQENKRPERTTLS